MRPKAYVAISDYSSEALDILKGVADVTIRSGGDRPTHDELLHLVSEFDILVIGVREKMTPEIHSQASRLCIIGTLSIGTDHIDPCFLCDERIRIINTPLSNVASVTEHTYALILAVLKRLVEAHMAAVGRKGRKGISDLPLELGSRTLGVVGAGNIGAKVARVALALGLKVLCYTYHPEKHTELADAGVRFLPLDELLEQADILTLHLPLTDESRGILSADRISLMKREAILVNTARSQLVDSSALSQYLRKGLLAGAALDCLEDDELSLFEGLPNVILTPHIAGLTKESIARMDVDLAVAITTYLSARPVLGQAREG